MSKDIFTKDWGDKPIMLKVNAVELRPTEIHLKSNGSKNNKPSLCIMMSLHGVPAAYGQVSIEMLNEAFNELGYKIEKL